MKFLISGSEGRSDGLRVIGEIPDYRLCHLEGRNGIGKSVGARLLELATGGQPYAALPHAWRTLKSQLGVTTLTVSGLPNGADIVFEIDPDDWPDDPIRDLGDAFSSVTIGGRATDVAEAHSLLRVRRISGDETLVQTLARDLEERAVLAESVGRLWVRPIARAWERSLAQVSDLVAGVTRSSLLEGWQRRVVALAAAEEASKRAARAVSASSALADATTEVDRAAARRRDLPALVAELTAATVELGGTRTQLGVCNARVEQASLALAVAGSIRNDVDKWERLRVLRQRAVQRERIRERQLLGALHLEVRPEPLELSQLIREARDATAEALARRDQVDLVKPRLDLARQIEGPLAAARPRLGSEVIASTTPALTVDALLDGVRDLREELSGKPRPDDLARLDREIDSSQRRHTLLRALGQQAEVTDRKLQNLAEAEATLAALFSDLDESDRTTYERAREAAVEARDAVIEAELRTREIRKQIAEILDIAPSAPVAGPESSNDEAVARPDEDDEDDVIDEPAAVESLYPDLDETVARESARGADQRAAAALGLVDEAEVSEAIGSEEPWTLDALRSAIASDPMAPLDEAALLDLRKLHEVAARSRAAAASMREDAEHSASLAADADQRVSALRALISDACAQLSPGGAPEWEAWATAAQPLIRDLAERLEAGRSAAPSEDELVAADALEAVGAIANAQVAASFAAADQLATLSGYLGSIAGSIAPGNRDGGALRTMDYGRTVGGPLRTWVEDVLAESLTTPELLTELFDSTEHVRVGLDDLTLTWRPPGGGIRKRPLEAFSSGEQVFAYTRANLMRISRERREGQSVVVFLDEFGAFVARDRLGQLMHFVENEALGTVADQVVIMLPLSRDYSLATGPSDEDEPGVDTLAERSRQVAARGYFAVPFDSGTARIA
jgi:hypothetical protein